MKRNKKSNLKKNMDHQTNLSPKSFHRSSLIQNKNEKDNKVYFLKQKTLENVIEKKNKINPY